MKNKKWTILIIPILVLFLPILAIAEIFVIEPVATNLSIPVAITHAGDNSGRLFITLQAGRILIYNGSEVLPTPFLDINPLVSCCGERGLLNVAFHPDYQNNGLFYVNYTNSGGDTVIARYNVSIDPDVADPGSGVILLTVPQPFGNHNGGQLQFGPDGYLYIGMGDGGSGGDPQNNAQNPATLLGKMLRIDIDSAFPYAIPSDNPFIGDKTVREEIWAFGLRNPWRFSFDRLTGDLFIADVGQNSWEEVDFQPASSPGGENYGWRLMEGNHCFDPPAGCNNGTLILPILEYDHSSGCSITGGYRYRGSEIPGLYGTYLYGDYCSGRIWSATKNNGIWNTTELLNTNFLISAFGENEEGEMFFAHYSSNSGTIYRIKAVLPTPDIKANSIDGALTITRDDTISITVEFVSGSYLGVDADWWLAASTPYGMYHYDLSSDSWIPGLTVTYQSPLFDLTFPFIMPDITGIPVGVYIFYFGLDTKRNGLVDFDLLYFDKVKVNITE